MKVSNLLSVFILFYILYFVGCENPLTKIIPAQNAEGISQGGLQTRVELSKNYPNPFHGYTTIEYRIPTAMHVRIKVYTEEWEEREILVDEYDQSGAYRVNYRAPDLPSGEYYYTMEAGGSILIRKMKCVK